MVELILRLLFYVSICRIKPFTSTIPLTYIWRSPNEAFSMASETRKYDTHGTVPSTVVHIVEIYGLKREKES